MCTQSHAMRGKKDQDKAMIRLSWAEVERAPFGQEGSSVWGPVPCALSCFCKQPPLPTVKQ